MEWSDYLTSAIGGGTNGFFVGHGMVSGGSAGAGIAGALIMAGAQIGISALSNSEKNDAQKKANNCP